MKTITLIIIKHHFIILSRHRHKETLIPCDQIILKASYCQIVRNDFEIFSPISPRPILAVSPFSQTNFWQQPGSLNVEIFIISDETDES